MERDERQLLIDVSVMYYLEGKTQSEIAKELYVSRPKVSRLLKKAREVGVVDININYESDSQINLQNKIKNKFNVNNIYSVKTLATYEETLEEIGKEAAKALTKEIDNDITVGISWGNTIRSAVSNLKKRKLNNVKIVELFGAISYDMDEADLLSIGTTLARKVGGKLYPLPAPIYIGDKKTRDILTNSPIIKSSLDMVGNCNIILTGLGAIDGDVSQKLWEMYIENDTKDRIKQAGGVGFLCAHFFDKNGQFLNIDINENIIGIKTEEIKKNKIILMAGGLKKAKALLAVLKGGYIDTLVTDEKTLERVLELSNEE